MRRFRYGFLLLAGVLNCGCFGTYATRSNVDVVGRYPGFAVYFDACCMVAPDNTNHGSGGFFRVMGFLSIIPDLVIDTVLLPVDLVAWPFGCKRDSYH